MNNPINRSDDAGNRASWLTSIYCYEGRRIYYPHPDPDPAPGDYIDNQSDSAVSDWATGWFGNISDNGCGLVALYNAMTAADKGVKFTTVCNKYNGIISSLWNFFLFGKLGMNPISMGAALRNEFGIRNVHSNAFGDGQEYDAIVVFYGWRNSESGNKGAHYFTAVNNGNNMYVSYNDDFDMYGKSDLYTNICKDKWLFVYSWGINF